MINSIFNIFSAIPETFSFIGKGLCNNRITRLFSQIIPSPFFKAGQWALKNKTIVILSTGSLIILVKAANIFLKKDLNNKKNSEEKSTPIEQHLKKNNKKTSEAKVLSNELNGATNYSKTDLDLSDLLKV